MSERKLEEYIESNVCNNERKTHDNDHKYTVKIDGQKHTFEDPKVTGQQLLRTAGKRPVDEHLIFQILDNGDFEEIRLAETTDLQKPGLEKFLTFESSASYRFVIDGERIEWGAKKISGRKLKKIAGVDPETYSLWREVRGGNDLPVEDKDFIDLSEDGLERFFTVIASTTAGSSEPLIPSIDSSYLGERGLEFEEVSEGGQVGIILKGYPVPKSNLDTSSVDLLILLPSGYPDSPPDMFYCEPWIRLNSNANFPKCADVSHSFAGKSWQRWSRHNTQWRPGTDGIWTMLKRVDHAFMEAA